LRCHIPHLDVAFAPQVNDYNGRRAVPLKVLDWRALQAPIQWSADHPTSV
jgi:hypothetical protein